MANMEEEARRAKSLDEAGLLEELGSQIAGAQAFSLDARDLKERATRWLKAQQAALQDHVCPDPRVYDWCMTKTETDDVSLVIELAKLLQEFALPVKAVTLAALLAKRGLKEFCGPRWIRKS